MNIEEIIKRINNSDNPVPKDYRFQSKGFDFGLELNKTGCYRIVGSIPVTDEDKAFFSSRQTALEAYTAALLVQDYNEKVINSIEKVRLELLQFITKKKKELNLEETNLDFDGNVYFIQISHGPGCKNH
jgi:hypothetical protein